MEKSMKYQEYVIYPAAEELDLLVEELSAAGLDQLVIQDPKDTELFNGDGTGTNWNYIDKEVLESVRNNPAVTFYLAMDETLSERAASIVRRFDHKRTVVDDEDWLHKWEEYYVPVRLSPRVVAKPAWRQYEPKEGDIVIEIDPGLAFGTGTSPTTYLAVRLMEKYVKPGDRVLDVGSGTGILSCVAAKLGASHITAVDLDPEAVRSTLVNVKLNGCEDLVTTGISDLLNDTEDCGDVICANLLAPLIIKLAPDVPAHCQGRGLFISSGIIDTMEEPCVKAVEEAGFEVIDIERDQGWSAIAAVLKR